MRDILGDSLKYFKWVKKRRKLVLIAVLVLSLFVTLDVFWSLRQPALTLAGDATCGITEHAHDETCDSGEEACTIEEHTHSIKCYADKTADVETALDWQEMFADYPFTGDLRQDFIGIAKTQVGYTESELNYEVDGNGERHGYTRYGAWYSAPYREWSAMFVSFCLNYAGADEKETPFNIGVSSMIKDWEALDKYTEAKEYIPKAGDLVFFTDNTVGIVTDVQSATIYVVRGDVENAVSSSMMSREDASIKGWGLLEGSLKKGEKVDNMDVSEGPIVRIYEGSNKKSQTRKFALKNTRSNTDLISYLEAHNGNYFFTLLDTNNQELPKDANGNYIVTAGTSYKLTLTIYNPDGFAPGTYLYHLPDGMIVNGGTGEFILNDDTNVGDWEVTDDGQITLNFNEHMNSRSEITISATMGIMFPEQEEPLDFDGKISVTIEPPSEEDITTEVYKWGSQGVEGNGGKDDTSKLYWTMQIVGRKDSNLPGSIITDQVIMGDHSYTESDIARGLHFGASVVDPQTGMEAGWHEWDVSPNDPNVTWTKNGWTYKIPETVKCKYCGQIQLGNDGWTYYVDYSSTPAPAGVVGTLGYMNRVTVDGQQAEGWASFTHGQAHADIIKHGTFRGDAENGAFAWEFQATIPGKRDGEKADYSWIIMDNMSIRDNNYGTVAYVTNDSNLSTVTATNNGTTVHVPNVRYATANDEFAWGNSWSTEYNGIYYGRALDLYCQCHCSEENCHFWNGNSCESRYWYEADDGRWYTNGFCICWNVERDTTFTFAYETKDLSIIEKYGGMDYNLLNYATLYNKVQMPDGNWESVNVAEDDASVKIPSVFKKELTHDFNGYTANYEITVNESKLNLTNGKPLTIHDEMTETLAFISGSLVVTTEDKDGNRETLQQGVDYTVTYDGTGTQKDENGKSVHVLDIVILRPQPVMYILDYDTTLIIPPGTTQAVKYSNSANITLWGMDISDTSAEKVHADINIAAKTYKVEMHKKDSVTGEPLPGATFGLYNDQGGLITSEVTDIKGELLYETSVVEGIILREHELYYIQEIAAPPGYMIDDTKYWICFCNETTDDCDECEAVMKGLDVTRIPFEQVGKVHVENTPVQYDLPATGGYGTYPLILISITLILIALVLGFIRRHDMERRDSS